MILDIQVTSTVVLLSIEHVCFIHLWFSNVGRFFFISIKLEDAVKVENGGEALLRNQKLGIRQKGRTGTEIENYG